MALSPPRVCFKPLSRRCANGCAAISSTVCAASSNSPAPPITSPAKLLPTWNSKSSLSVNNCPPSGLAASSASLISPSHRALERIWRAHGLLHPRRRKYQRKQDLAHIKATWRLFQQISADTKDLDDIPHYWPQAQTFDLPVIEYTAREVRSGLLFLAFAQRRSLPPAPCSPPA